MLKPSFGSLFEVLYLASTEHFTAPKMKPHRFALIALLDYLLQHRINLMLSQAIQLYTSLHAIIIAGPNPGPHPTALADQDRQRWIQRFQVCIIPLNIIPGDSGSRRVLAAMDSKLLHHLRKLPSPRHDDSLFTLP